MVQVRGFEIKKNGHKNTGGNVVDCQQPEQKNGIGRRRSLVDLSALDGVPQRRGVETGDRGAARGGQ